MQQVFTLYRRRNLLREGETAWELEERLGSKRRTREFTSYKTPVSLEEFARMVAENDMKLSSKTRQPIKATDALTSIPSAVFVPGNEYIDEPVSSQQLIDFWRAYQPRLLEKL